MDSSPSMLLEAATFTKVTDVTPASDPFVTVNRKASQTAGKPRLMDTMHVGRYRVGGCVRA